MHKKLLIAAAIFGGLAVALSAFGAHALKRITTDPTILDSFETATRYQMFHALALLAMVGFSNKWPDRLLTLAANCFIAGIIVFCGSLYILTYLKINDSDAVNVVGPITPAGGLLLIAGWVILLVMALKQGKSER